MQKLTCSSCRLDFFPDRRYEGEFHTGFVNGLGQYTGANGEVYRGEWLYGKRHGYDGCYHCAGWLRGLAPAVMPDMH
jgi:hypothetical protein